jgi:hypothetical protein
LTRRFTFVRWPLAILVSLLPFRPSPAGAQTNQVFEISSSCVAVNQRIPSLTVWGSGFEQWMTDNRVVDVEWHWGGEPTTPRVATVQPPSRRAPGGSFTMSFDVTGLRTGFSAFSAVAKNPDGSIPTNVDSVNLEVKDTCPSGRGTCGVDQGRPVLQVETQGYPSDWAHQFFYQYRQKDQAGPVAGTPGSDGAVHGEFRNLRQATSPTVTARIQQPVEGDGGGGVFFVTFPVPVCTVPTPTPTSPTPTATTPQPTSGTTSTTPTTGAPPPAPSFSPTLTANPSVGYDGAVVTVTGQGFPPDVDVMLTWQPGIGTVGVHSDSGGGFVTALLVMPHDETGWRQVLAAGHPSAAAPFLVQLGTARPPRTGRYLGLFR